MQNSPQLMVNLVTKIAQFAVPSTPFNLDGHVGSKELDKLVKTLIAEVGDTVVENVDFEFLINGKLLKVCLQEFVESQGLSRESQIEIEYVLKQQSPTPFNSLLHDDWVSCVTANDTWVISGCYDNTLHIWDLTKEGRHKIAIPAHAAPVKAVRWIPDHIDHKNPDDYLFVSCSHDETSIVWKWNSTTNEVEYLFACRGHCRSVDCVDVHKDLIATGSYDQMLKIWSLTRESDVDDDTDENVTSSKKRQKKTENDWNKSKNRVPIMTLSGHSEAVTGCVWMESAGAESESHVATCSMDNTIKIWDIEVGECKQTLTGSKAFLAISHSPFNGLLVTGSCDRHIRLWDPRSDTGSIVKSNYTSHQSWVSSIRWSTSNENYFISGSYDNVVKQWDLRSTSVPIYDLLGHENKVLCVDWSNANFIVSGGADNHVKVYANNINSP